MGISINNKNVTVNSIDQEGVSIHWCDNPQHQKVGGFEVLSVFGRRKLKGDIKGDGNPLVHALKANRGYNVEDHSMRKLHYHGARVVKKIIRFKSPDLLFCLPSSARLNLVFSNYIQKMSNAELAGGAFTKSTFHDLIKNKVPVNTIPPKHKAEYKSTLTRIENGRPESVIELKEIPNSEVIGLTAFSGLKAKKLDIP